MFEEDDSYDAYGLFIPQEKFQEMVLLDVGTFVKDVGGLDYLSWARALYLLKLNFPTLSVVFCTTAYGTPWFDVEIPSEWVEDPVRGTMVGCYLKCMETGKRSQTVYLPVMTYQKKKVKPAAIQPDVRVINDSLQRCAAKAIAIVTGIGFNLFLQMDEDDLEDAGEESSRKVDKEEKDDRQPVRFRYGEESDDEEEEKELKSSSRSRRRLSTDDEDEEEDDDKPMKRRFSKRGDDEEDFDEEEEEVVSKRRNPLSRRLPR